MSLIQKLFSQSVSKDSMEPNSMKEEPASDEVDKLRENLAIIASETFRFQKTLNSVLSKLAPEEQQKYCGQFTWYLKRVGRALEDSGFRLLDLEGERYDPGMAVTPLNIEDFSPEDILYIEQMIEPIVMLGGSVRKAGTVVLERHEE